MKLKKILSVRYTNVRQGEMRSASSIQTYKLFPFALGQSKLPFKFKLPTSS